MSTHSRAPDASRFGGRLWVRLGLLGACLAVGWWAAYWVLLYQPWTHTYVGGDGVFVDKGWRATGGNRYVIRLATVSLARDRGRVLKFRIGRVPVPMVLQLRFPNARQLRGSMFLDSLSFGVQAGSQEVGGAECIQFMGNAPAGGTDDPRAATLDWLTDDVAVQYGTACPGDADYLWPSSGSPFEVEFVLQGWSGEAWAGEDPVLELVGGPWAD